MCAEILYICTQLYEIVCGTFSKTPERLKYVSFLSEKTLETKG